MVLSEIIKFPPSHDRRKALCTSQRDTTGAEWKGKSVSKSLFARARARVRSLSHLQLPVMEIDPALGTSNLNTQVFNPVLFFQVMLIAVFPSIYPSSLF